MDSSFINCLKTYSKNSFYYISLILCCNGVVFADTMATAKRDSTGEKVGTAVLEKVVTSATGFSLPLRDEAKNIIIINKEDLQNKGYTNLEQALEKQPTISFTQGPQGTKEIDIRGQGQDAARAVKVLINRVPINLHDPGNPGHNANSATPFNQISVDDIESIEIIPGGGAVVYGSGTKGGVVNIVTKKPSKDYARFNLRGNSFDVWNTLGGGAGVAGGKKIGDNLFFSATANYSYQNGLRPGEYTHNIYTSFQNIWQIDEQSKLDFNISYSKMWRKFAGYHTRATGCTGSGSQTCTGLKDRETMKNERYIAPSASDSKGEVNQDFVQMSFNYRNKINDDLDLDAIAFYQFSNFYFPSQTFGSTKNFLNNHIAGINLKTRWSYEDNVLITGLDNQLEYSDTLSKSSAANTRNQGSKYALSLYGLDTYNFNDSFSLIGGVRGEVSYFNIGGHTGMTSPFTQTTSYHDIDVSKWHFGYALELTPNFNYSDTGSIYVKEEIGFISPNIRQAISTDPNWNGNIKDEVGPKVASDIKPEQYFTSEIGWRDEFEYSYLSLCFTRIL